MSKFRMASIFKRSPGAATFQARRLGEPVITIAKRKREMKRKIDNASRPKSENGSLEIQE
jgi:hypothetical protein